MNMGVGVKEGKLSEVWRQNMACVQAIAERRPDLHRIELVTTCVTIGGETFAQLQDLVQISRVWLMDVEVANGYP